MGTPLGEVVHVGTASLQSNEAHTRAVGAIGNLFSEGSASLQSSLQGIHAGATHEDLQRERARKAPENMGTPLGGVVTADTHRFLCLVHHHQPPTANTPDATTTTQNPLHLPPHRQLLLLTPKEKNWELLCVLFLGFQEKATRADPILNTGEVILM